VKAQARRDIASIGEYIGLDNPDRSITFVDELTGKFRTIAERPLSYPNRADLVPDLRSALHGKYLLLFRIEGECVVILRVLHGARDIGSLF
jgi:toxin ParE1/3/4